MKPYAYSVRGFRRLTNAPDQADLLALGPINRTARKRRNDRRYGNKLARRQARRNLIFGRDLVRS